MKLSTDNTELGKNNSDGQADNEEDNEFDEKQLRGSYNDYKELFPTNNDTSNRHSRNLSL